MKLNWLRKAVSIAAVPALAGAMLTGCGSGTSASGSTTAAASDTQAEETTTVQTTQSTADASSDSTDDDIEVWTTNNGFKAVEHGSQTYEFYKKLLGVGVVQPYVEWNGGQTYLEQLNLRIAAGDMPDIFTPVQGVEIDLIRSGALLDLTDLLPEKAPHLWNSIPQEVWNAVKASDPTGNDRIYSVPTVITYGRNGAMIRKDWLDKLGLEMPATQEEFVNVLKAFKEKDPNGNGMPDEIPTGGRAEARWMSQLFGQYGIAIWEGYPQFDLYDGQLTYSAVTKNMRDCLQWMSELYKQGLLDPETLLNDKAAWDGKINSGVVGCWEHIPQECYNYAENIYSATGEKPEIAVLPAISAPGYEGFYTEKQMNGSTFVLAKTDDETKIDREMKILDAFGNQDLWMDFYNGVEGMHSQKVDGKLVRLPDDPSTQENLIFTPYNNIATIDFQIDSLTSQLTDDRSWSVQQAIDGVQELQKYVKTYAGDGLPDSIYEDYPDIQNRTLYVEYASKIITGEYPIEKFDEFVDQWNRSGGEEVTKRAREWYTNK